ncbi:hypothetical protein MKW94_017712 [Papaver nudicaule]|uniref:CG-1 domain-containing protein n=1 Tax=Papaver nudicaule TaxID=74823 RepID=A0AA41S3X2_PAPNU|nr:hypothetical protein [Papaver nudicaule]MCL7037581.1 hypothetical protein [Papaver nudicaule]
MESNIPGDRLVGSDIHGFITLNDLDKNKLLEDAKTRWFRPNEVYAILCNYKCFSEIQRNTKLHLPKGGTIVLYDRKTLRNFRNDGHDWKEKKNSTYVQEGHEHLKVGQLERIHAYYALGLAIPNLARRCYWILDKDQENIVLVHYRELEQVQSSPITSANSNSPSAHCLNASSTSESGGVSYEQQNQYSIRNSRTCTSGYSQERNTTFQTNYFESATGGESSSMSIKESLQTEESFEVFMDSVMADSLDLMMNQLTLQFQVVTMNQIIAVGYFRGAYSLTNNTRIFCVFGDVCSPAERVIMGVFRCKAFPHDPGFVSFYLSVDGNTPISQVLSFEYRFPPVERMALLNEHPKGEEFQLQLRLVNLLFSSSNSLRVLSRKSTSAHLDKKLVPWISSSDDKDWEFLESLRQNKIPISQGKDMLTQLTLMKKLKEWILERVVEGSKTSARDHQGRGVIHLCTILDYKWVVQLKEMVAVLLSEGADPSLVTDPTSEFPGGCTAADIASRNGHEGIAAYLAEKGLTTQFLRMSVSKNISGSLQTKKSYPVDPANLSEEQLCHNDASEAVVTSTDLALSIQSAFLEDLVSKRKTGAVQDTDEANFRGHHARNQYKKIIWAVGVLEKVILRWRQKRKGLRGFIAPQLTQTTPVEDMTRSEYERVVICVQSMFRSKRAQEEYRMMKLTHDQENRQMQQMTAH